MFFCRAELFRPDYIFSAQHVYSRQFGVEGGAFAALYSLAAVGILVGQLANRALVHRIGTLLATLIAMSVSTVAGAVGLLLSAVGLLGAVGYATVMLFVVMGLMTTVANGHALVMDPHGRIAGLAASVLGGLTFFFGALGGTMIAWASDGDATVALLGMVGFMVAPLVMTCDWFWRARQRHAAMRA